MDAKEDSMPKMLVVLNPKGGQADRASLDGALGRHCPPTDWEVHIHESVDGEDFAPVIQEAVKAKYDVVAAAGGDGTVSAVANTLVGTDVPLAILPVGTGNALARELGLPMALDRACALISGKHQLRVIDVMKVRDRYCLINVSAGLSAMAMRDTTGESKHRYGMLAYVLTAIRGLAGFQPRRYRLEIDANPINVRASDVLVVNGSTPVESLVRAGPGVQLDDGVMGVYVIRARTLLDLALTMLFMLWPSKGRDRRVRFFDAAKSVVLSAQPPAVLQADGDGIGYTPVTIELVRQALRVIVPLPPSDAFAEAGALIERVVHPGGVEREG